jgi:hypothetical protein
MTMPHTAGAAGTLHAGRLHDELETRTRRAEDSKQIGRKGAARRMLMV